MIGIYVWINKINNKKYVGQSKNIQQRKNRHIRESLNNDNKLPLYVAIRKYGLDNFDFKVLEECTLEELDEKEITYIKSLNTLVPNGYNITTGGQHGTYRVTWTFSKEKLLQVYTLLRETELSFSEIGEIFGVSGSMIGQINRGEHYSQNDYIYPIRKHEVCLKIQQKKCSEKLRGENSYRCSITEEIARLIIEDLIQDDIRETEIAKKYNTTIDVVKDINKGKSWKWIERPIPCRKDHGNSVLNEDIVFDIIALLLDPTKDNDDIYKLDPRITYKMIYRINNGINWKQDFLNYPLRKYHLKKGKLKLTEVIEIIEELHSTKTSTKEIAEKYNISYQAVLDINNHKSYSFLSDIYPNPIRSK